MTIGQVALQAKCPVQTIRYYEAEGLLPEAARTAGNYRLYARAHVERLSFIRNCRSLDMTLDEIRELLRLKDAPQETCGETHALLAEHIAHVSTRIAELQDLERQLKTLRRRCRAAGRKQDCGILQGLERDEVQAPRTKIAPHVRGVHHG